MSFDIHTRVFRLTFTTPSSSSSLLQSGLPTEVFVPLYHYPSGVDVTVSDGHFEYRKDLQVSGSNG
jgi:hypothetical protein